MGIAYNTSIVMDTLYFYLDYANIRCYPGSGTSVFDLYSTGTGATMVNGVGTSSTFNGSFFFDGVNDYLSFSTSLINNKTQGTFQFFTYVSDLSNSTLISRQHNGVNTFDVLSVGYSINGFGAKTAGTSGKIYYHKNNATGNLTSSAALTLNTWNMINLSFSGTACTLYINGVQDSTVSGDYTTVNDTTTDCRFGAWDNSEGSSGYLKGNIASISIYDRTLTAAEIKKNYNAMKKRYGL
jgi:hypothetical protein